jgi:hypothetical protein
MSLRGLGIRQDRSLRAACIAEEAGLNDRSVIMVVCADNI